MLGVNISVVCLEGCFERTEEMDVMSKQVHKLSPRNFEAHGRSRNLEKAYAKLSALPHLCANIRLSHAFLSESCPELNIPYFTRFSYALPTMPRGPPPFMVVLGAVIIFLVFVVYTADHGNDHLPVTRSQPVPKVMLDSHATVSEYASSPRKADAPALHPSTLHEKPIASKLGNETLKAELGRAAWKLFHTTMARFPDTPAQDESDALKSYIYLFARLYPCGECAEHFQGILKKYPPQTSSRSTAAAWACFVHNEVNISKGKEIFDCNNIGDFYDCGCAEDEEKASSSKKSSALHEEPFEITREGLTRGG